MISGSVVPILRSVGVRSRALHLSRLVVVGNVVEVEKHPNADRLHCCKVQVTPEGEAANIICGAPNVKSGMQVAVALPGAVLNPYDFTSDKVETLQQPALKIKKSKIRGQRSEGMICSLSELGFLDDHENGIWSIPQEVSAGPGDVVQAEWVQQKPVNESREEFRKLLADFDRSFNLKSCLSLLHWDEQTTMPANAAASRAQQKAQLAQVCHEHETSEVYQDRLKSAVANPHLLNVAERRSCEIALEEYHRANAVSSQQVHDLAELQSRCTTQWQRAKAKGDFSHVAPVLKDLLQLTKEVTALGKLETEATIYDSLLARFSKGMSTEQLSQRFQTITSRLGPLAKEASSSSQFSKVSNISLFASKDSHDIANQMDLCNFVLNAIVGDETVAKKMKFETSAHPFSIGIARDDVRITTRFDPFECSSSVMAAMHEAGHGMYELGLPNVTLPAGGALDFATHESQALFWERMVGQSESFWKFATPRIKQSLGYGTTMKDATWEDLYRSINLVGPNLIRVNADELHYPLHISIRFAIERDLFEGSLAVEDIPAKWNSLYHETLGVTPKDDSDGCLQDIHWYTGAFGYFASYTIGAVFASQLYETAVAEVPDLEESVEQGEFSSIRQWLSKQVYARGAMPTSSDELCKSITGQELSVDQYCSYLEKKYAT